MAVAKLTLILFLFMASAASYPIGRYGGGWGEFGNDKESFGFGGFGGFFGNNEEIDEDYEYDDDYENDNEYEEEGNRGGVYGGGGGGGFFFGPQQEEVEDDVDVDVVVEVEDVDVFVDDDLGDDEIFIDESDEDIIAYGGGGGGFVAGVRDEERDRGDIVLVKVDDGYYNDRRFDDGPGFYNERLLLDDGYYNDRRFDGDGIYVQDDRFLDNDDNYMVIDDIHLVRDDNLQHVYKIRPQEDLGFYLQDDAGIRRDDVLLLQDGIDDLRRPVGHYREDVHFYPSGRDDDAYRRTDVVMLRNDGREAFGDRLRVGNYRQQDKYNQIDYKLGEKSINYAGPRAIGDHSQRGPYEQQGYYDRHGKYTVPRRGSRFPGEQPEQFQQGNWQQDDIGQRGANYYGGEQPQQPQQFSSRHRDNFGQQRGGNGFNQDNNGQSRAGSGQRGNFYGGQQREQPQQGYYRQQSGNRNSGQRNNYRPYR